MNEESIILHVSRRDRSSHPTKHTTNQTVCLQQPRYDSINRVAALWDERPNNRSSIPCRGIVFAPLHSIQTVYTVHPLLHPTGIGRSFLGVKRTRREAYFSPSSSAEVLNEWRYTFSPYTPSWRAHGQHYLSAFCKTEAAIMDNLNLHVCQISWLYSLCQDWTKRMTLTFAAWVGPPHLRASLPVETHRFSQNHNCICV